MKTEMNQELAIRYLTKSASDSERKVFEEWLNASEEHAKQYTQMKRYWESMGNIYNSFNPDIEEAWQGVSEHTVNKSIIKRLWSKPNQFLKIAATILVVLSVGLSAYYIVNPTIINKAQFISYTTNNDIKEIVLPDGSKIWLNKNSNLEAPKEFIGNFRNVYLNGEAFFEVKKDHSKPFLIHSKNTVTQVVGTSFNVKARENDDYVCVTVTTGKVAFYNSKKVSSKIYLLPGEKGTYSTDEESIKKELIGNNNYLAWKTGIIQFKETPFSEVCKVLSEYYNMEIDIDSIKAKEISFTGSFDNSSIDSILIIIEKTLDIKFVKRNNIIEVQF
jgi:transmembrane sensor